MQDENNENANGPSSINQLLALTRRLLILCLTKFILRKGGRVLKINEIQMPTIRKECLESDDWIERGKP